MIGLDGSTQSAKAVAWIRDGAAAAEGRTPSPRPGRADLDPEDWWTAACVALRAVAAQRDPGRVAGQAMSKHRETVALTDASGASLRTALLWLDEQGRDFTAPMAAAPGADRLHAATGKPVDLTPTLYRFASMRAHEPGVLDAARMLDAQAYLALRLTGTATASCTSADASGLFDIEAKRWSAPVSTIRGCRRTGWRRSRRRARPSWR